MSKHLFSKGLLYFILNWNPEMKINPLSIAYQALEGGVDIIQLRAKGINPDDLMPLAMDLSKMARDGKKMLIINKHLRVVQEVGAHGIHLGQDAVTPKQARLILGKDIIVGASVHSIEEVQAIAKDDVDYLLVSNIFATDCKPGVEPKGLLLMKQIQEQSKTPIIALGGINADNIPLLNQHGFSRVGVMSAISKAKDIRGAARELKTMLK